MSSHYHVAWVPRFLGTGCLVPRITGFQKVIGTTVCTVYSVQCTVYSVQCTVYSVQCTVYSVQCTVYSVQCTVYSVQCTVYSVQCTVYSVQENTREGKRLFSREKIAYSPSDRELL